MSFFWKSQLSDEEFIFMDEKKTQILLCYENTIVKKNGQISQYKKVFEYWIQKFELSYKLSSFREFSIFHTITIHC